MFFGKNQEGGILPQSKRSIANQRILKGNAEITKQKHEYDEDLAALTKLDERMHKNDGTLKDLTARQRIYDNTMKNATDRQKSFGQQMVNNTKTLSDFKQEYEVDEGAIQKTKTFGDSAKSFAASAVSGIANLAIDAIGGMLFEGAVNLALKGFDYVINYERNLIAKGEEAKDSIASQTHEFNAQKDSLTKLSASYADLAKGVTISGNRIKNVSLTDSEYEEFLNLSNQIANITPSLVKSYDSQGNAILNLGNSTNDINNTIEDYIKLQRDLTHIDTKTSLKDQYKGVTESAQNIKDEINSLDSQIAHLDMVKAEFESFSNKIDFIGPTMPGKGIGTYSVASEYEKEFRELFGEYGLTLENGHYTEDGKFEFELDTGSLSITDRGILSTSIEGLLDSQKQEYSLLQSQLKQQELLLKSEWKELVPSIQSYIDSSNMFDELDVDKADTIRDNLKTMIGNIDYSTIASEVEKAGSIDKWIDQQLIAPMVSGSQEVQDAWAGLFDLEANKEGTSLSEFAKQRNEYLKTIAKSQGVSFEEMASRLGYATLNEDGSYTWSTKSEIDRAAERTGIARSGEGSIGEYLNGLTVEDYEIAIDLILNGDEVLTSIAAIKQALQEAKDEAAETALKEKYSVSSMRSDVETTKAALSTLSTGLSETQSSTGLTGDTVAALKAQYSELIESNEALKDYDLNNIFETSAEGVKLNYEEMEHLIDAQSKFSSSNFVEALKLANKELATYQATTSEADKQTDEYKNKVKELEGNISNLELAQAESNAIFAQQKALFSDYNRIKTEVATVQNILSASQSAISESMSSTGMTADTIAAIKQQFTTLLEDTELENLDLNSIFTSTAEGVKISSDALEHLIDVQNNLTSSKIEKAILAQKQAIEEYESSGKSAASSNEEYNATLRTMKNELYGLYQAQSQNAALYKQQKTLFSDYAQWQNAQSTANAGDQYTNMVAGLKSAKDLWDKGLVGTDDFKSFAALISPTGAEDPENFAENYAKAAKYLTEDVSGVKNFLNDLETKGLAEFNEETKQWAYNIEDMTKAAQQMGMGEDFMYAMFGRLEDYGFHNNFIESTEDGVLKLSDAYSELAKAEAELEYLETFDKDNTTAIEQKKQEIENLNRDIIELGDNLADYIANAAESYNQEVETAKTSITSLAEQRKKILEDNTYGENTQAVADYLAMQINSWAEQYGIELDGEFNIVGMVETEDSLESIVTAANAAKEALRETGETDINLDFEYESATLSDLESYLESLEKDRELKIEAGESTEEVDVLISNITAMMEILSDYEANPEITINDLSDAYGKVNQVQSLLNQVEGSSATASVDVENDGAQEELDTLISELAQLDQETLISIGFTTDGDTITEEDIRNQIGQIEVPLIFQPGDTTNAEIDSANAEVDYTLGSQEEPVPKEATVNYIKDFQEPPSDAYANVHYLIGSQAKPDDKIAYVTYVEKHARGTMSAPALASGTAYNVSNYIPVSAYASGRVDLPQDERALVNELGTESIIRNGKWFLIPGGMHMENLKKGDIVLNHMQTKDLIQSGKTLGVGKAYASGTASHARELANAYYTGYGNFSAGAADQSLTGNTNAQKDNTDATTNNTSATNDNTKAAEDFTETIDWVAERLQYFADRTKRIADTITDYVSFAFKERQLKRQFNSIDTEVNANQKAYDTYLKKANSVKLSAEWKKKVQQGDYVIEDIKDKNLAENIKKYQEYYDKAKDCESAVLSLQAEQRRVFEDLMNIPTEKAEKKIDKLSKAIDSLNNAYDNMSGGSHTTAYLKQLEKDKNTQLKTVTEQKKVADAEYKASKDLYTKATTNKGTAEITAKMTASNLNATTKSLQNVVKKNKNNLTQGQINGINNAIKNGTKISTKSLSGKVLEWAKKYNADLDAKNKAANELESAEKFQAMAKSEYITATSNKKSTDNAYESAKKGLSEVQNNLKNYKNNKTFENQNALLDQELAHTKKINDARQTALKDTSKNLADQADVRDASKKLRDNASKKILNNFDKELTKAQKTALEAGQTVSLTGVKDEKLRKQLENYNELVREYSLTCEDYSTALKIQEEAMASASEAQAEYVQMMVDNEIKKFENIQTFYESLGGLNATFAESYSTDRRLKESLGEDTSIDDFEKEIIELQEQKAIADESVSELRKQLQKSVDSGIIIEGSEEWIQMTQGILEAEMEAENLHMDVLELQDTMRNEVFYRELNKALEKSEELRSSLSSISNLINDEMMFDDDGMYTDFGVTALATGIKEYESYLGSMETLLEKREAFIKAYNNGDNNTNYNQKEFEADMANIEEEIRNMLSNTNSARQAIIGIILDQSKAELDATIKVIDAREELLKKQKEYYDYDKTLKNKTKDLQLLDQQIAALDGVADAESRAQKARLEAQRMELREELDETVKDHRYEMHIAGLDDLKTELQDNYDNYVKELNQNLDMIVSTVTNATDSINGCLNTVNETIKYLLSSFNVEKLTTESIGVPQYASGSKYVKKTTKSLVNESGQEIIVTKMGTFMPLSYGDGVVPADLTAKLFSMAQNYPNFTPNIVIPEMTSGVNETIAPVIHCPITIMGNASEADITAALKKNLPYITKSVQNEIRKDLRKSGR